MNDQADLTSYTENGESSEWGKERIGHIFKNIRSGGTPERGVERYYEGDIPFVKIEDLNRQQLEGVSSAEESITEEAIKETNVRVFPPGTLLLTIYGVLAETAIVRSPVATNQAILGLWDIDNHNTLYVKYAIDNDKTQLESLSLQTTQANLGKGIIEKHQIPIPPIDEQRKIASVLYNIDKSIRLTEQIIDQIDIIQSGLTSRLFQEGPSRSDTKEYRLGPVETEIPKHWGTAKIGELYSERQLGTDERGTSDGEEPIDLIKMGNLKFGKWDFSEVEKIDRDADFSDELVLKTGDLLFNTRNTPELVGKTAVWEFDREAIYDNNLLRLRFGDRVSSGHFVNYYLSSEIGKRQLRSRVHGTTSVAAIYWSDLKQLEIPVPPKEEQDEIIQILQNHDEARQQNQSYHLHLQRLKQGLMQDLLSGKVRTTDTNIEVLPEVAAHG